MKIVFFGTDHFAKEILAYLLRKKVDILAVVTRPDKAKGRSGKATPPPVLESGYEGKVFQPEKASAPEFIAEMKALAPDLFVVVSYGQIIKQELLDIPKKGAINVHPSLLPKYRGPSPIQSQVIGGEEEVGVTIMEMVLKMDAGAILKVGKMALPEDMTFGELEEKLCDMAKGLLYEVIGEFERGDQIKKVLQDEGRATYTKKIETEASFIDWTKPSDEIHNFIRGMNPRPGARTFATSDGEKKILKILRTRKTKISASAPGKIIAFQPKEGFIVSCGDFCLEILEIQPEGKRKMNSLDFMNGFLMPVFS